MTTKDSNPKDAIGSTKPGISSIPVLVLFFLGAALFEGALKYGGQNWRAMGVRASVYYNALWRHVASWWCGEDIDPDSGLPHLAKAMACLAILLDAQQNGQLFDDRPPVPESEWMADVAKATRTLIERHGPTAKHAYTEANREHWDVLNLPVGRHVIIHGDCIMSDPDAPKEAKDRCAGAGHPFGHMPSGIIEPGFHFSDTPCADPGYDPNLPPGIEKGSCTDWADRDGDVDTGDKP